MHYNKIKIFPKVNNNIFSYLPHKSFCVFASTDNKILISLFIIPTALQIPYTLSQ